MSERRTPIVAVGGSTGGPAALREFLAALDGKTSAALVVAQHLPPDRFEPFADSLSRVMSSPVHLLDLPVAPQPGSIYVPVAHRSPIVSLTKRLQTLPCAERDDLSPDVDLLFTSAAAAYGEAALAVVLSGMGDSGLAGAQAVVAAGGKVLVQDEASSSVWGMPGRVAQAGLSSLVAAPRLLAAYVASLFPA